MLSLPDGLEVAEASIADAVLTLHIVATAKSSTCPLCAHAATRVRSYYTRVVADVPCAGRQVQLILHVRKFRCETADCPRHVFTERLAPFLEPWARTTTRLSKTIEAIGLATCGELGARFAPHLGIATSPTTILRRTMALPTNVPEQVTQLGIDDWSFRRGRKFGTILVDLTTHTVIDLLPDRTTETAAAWMQLHPEIEIVSRDRGGDYAAAARKGAPQAQQVADRFHLAKNLTEIAEVVLARIRPEIRKAVQSEESPLSQGDDGNSADWRPKTEADERQAGLARQAERCDRYQQMMEWYEQGLSTRDIARRLGVTTRSIQRWLKEGIPHGKPRSKRISCFDPYADAAIALWQNGALSSLQIWHALQTQGFKGSYNTVHRFIETLPEYIKRRMGNGELSKALPDYPLQNFQAREAVWLFVRDPSDLEKKEQEELTTICQASSTAETLYGLAQEFMQMIRHLKGERLDEWLSCVRASQIPELQSLVKSIKQDKAAVLAGLTLQHNNGVVEGKINKLKLIKRMMFGRAEFPLLRQRVLHAL